MAGVRREVMCFTGVHYVFKELLMRRYPISDQAKIGSARTNIFDRDVVELTVNCG